MTRRKQFFGAVCCLALALVLSACGDSSSGELRGIERTPLPEVGETALPDATSGEAVPFTAADGELLVVYFGYTHCPDVCPTTLSDLRSALEDLGDDAENIEVAMATIDPERDTADVLTPYVQSFVPDAVALRTTDDTELQAAADVFGVTYGVETTADGEVDVSHSGFLYAVDDRGQLVVTWPFGTTAEDVAHDLQLLIDQGAST